MYMIQFSQKLQYLYMTTYPYIPLGEISLFFNVQDTGTEKGSNCVTSRDLSEACELILMCEAYTSLFHA